MKRYFGLKANIFKNEGVQLNKKIFCLKLICLLKKLINKISKRINIKDLGIKPDCTYPYS